MAWHCYSSTRAFFRNVCSLLGLTRLLDLFVGRCRWNEFEFIIKGSSMRPQIEPSGIYGAAPVRAQLNSADEHPGGR
jgi:hypothetical protein